MFEPDSSQLQSIKKLKLKFNVLGNYDILRILHMLLQLLDVEKITVAWLGTQAC